jgi:hypothetical protein
MSIAGRLTEFGRAHETEYEREYRAAWRARILPAVRERESRGWPDRRVIVWLVWRSLPGELYLVVRSIVTDRWWLALVNAAVWLTVIARIQQVR